MLSFGDGLMGVSDLGPKNKWMKIEWLYDRLKGKQVKIILQ